MTRCFQIDPRDNVATLLDTGGGTIEVAGQDGASVEAPQSIERGHKVALRAIGKGGEVVKFGVPIGRATGDIAVGEWVHLHNCESLVDERSQGLHPVSGAASDTPYE